MCWFWMLYLLWLFWISWALWSLAFLVTKFCWCICNVVRGNYGSAFVFLTWLENIRFFILKLSLIIDWYCFFSLGCISFYNWTIFYCCMYCWYRLKISIREIWRTLSFSGFSSVCATLIFVSRCWIHFQILSGVLTIELAISQIICIWTYCLVIINCFCTWYLLLDPKIGWKTLSMTYTALSCSGLLTPLDVLQWYSTTFATCPWTILLLAYISCMKIFFVNLIFSLFILVHVLSS